MRNEAADLEFLKGKFHFGLSKMEVLLKARAGFRGGIPALFLALALACAATACSALPARGDEARAEPFTRARTDLLGTLVTISVFDAAPSDAALEALLDQCFFAIEDVDARMSVNRADSEISAVNEAAGGEPVRVSEGLYALLARAKAIAGLSGGAFDPAIGPITTLWKQDGVFARLPSREEIRERLPLVDYRDIELDARGGVRLAERGMALDLGGIAKGHACDSAVAVLREGGIEHAVLDFGGNVYVMGTKAGGANWRVGVRLPLAGESGVVCVVEAAAISVVTSGGYERFFERDGAVYHHLLDPETGFPAQSGLLSATVLARSSAEADGLSTACFVRGLAEGLRLLAESGCEGILIDADRRIHVTDGLKGAVEVTDARFSLA
ncbi:MAG: FAD:protein FMN transferase [Clostridiales Family XIII bacterium]|jgi:thiamine biosynthesis lipoprotein|nr:FAD:protein FMN transferase [Clostridiales Family XIII bacterium]